MENKNSLELPVELVAEVLSAIHLKPVFNSAKEWRNACELLTLSKSAHQFAGPIFQKRKDLLLQTIATVDAQLAQTERMLFRVENWTLEQHGDDARCQAIAREHRKQIAAARCWDSWIFQYHYKVLVWDARRALANQQQQNGGAAADTA